MINSSEVVAFSTAKLDWRVVLNTTTPCWVYKGTKREEMYLYVDCEDNFERVPPALINAMGELQLVIALELHATRKLARADARQVIKELNRQGYYLQMPPVQDPLIKGD